MTRSQGALEEYWHDKIDSLVRVLKLCQDFFGFVLHIGVGKLLFTTVLWRTNKTGGLKIGEDYCIQSGIQN